MCIPSANTDMPDEIKLLDEFLKRGADVIYFGDSTINWDVPSDKSDYNSPQLLQHFLPDRKVARISHSSYQSDIYESYAKYIVQTDKARQIKAVIIPVNMRMFSPQWDRQPGWQFEKEKITLRIKDTLAMKFYKPLEVFKFFEPRLNRFDYENTDVRDTDQVMGKVRDFDNPSYRNFSEENLKNIIRFHYMGAVPPDHRRLKALINAARIFQLAGIEPILYITPLDWETMTKVLGKRAIQQLISNTTVVTKALAENNLAVLDLSLSLHHSEFSWEEDGHGTYFPNEHLRIKGRIFVIAKLLKHTTLNEK